MTTRTDKQRENQVRKFAVGILAAGLFAAGAGTAFASSWHAIPKLTNFL
jgi:hypothetical protein